MICYFIPVRKLIFATGTGIEVWSSLCAQSAPFVVSVDGWQGKTFQPNINRNFSIEEPQLLFFQYGMSDTPKQHTLRISSGASSPGRNMIDINSFKVADAGYVVHLRSLESISTIANTRRQRPWLNIISISTQISVSYKHLSVMHVLISFIAL